MKRWILPSACIIAAYLSSFLILPMDGFWINDNGCKFIQMEALVQNHYQSASIPWPGQSLDPNFRFNPLPFPYGQVYDGKGIYGFYSPAFAFLQSLFLQAGGLWGLGLLPLMAGLLLMIPVWRIAGLLPGKRVGQPLSLLWVSLCTPLWFYSVSAWEHTIALVFALWAVLFGLRYQAQDAKPSHLVSSMACCSLAIYFRDELYLLAGVLMVVSFLSHPKSLKPPLLAGAAAGLFLCPLWWSQWRLTGNPLGSHVASVSPLAQGVGAFLSERWTVFRTLFLNAHVSLWVSLLACGPLVLILGLRPRVARWRPWIWALAGLGLLHTLIVAGGFLAAPSPITWLMTANGLLVGSPLLLLSGLRGPDTPHGKAGSRSRLLWIAIAYGLAFSFLAPSIRVIGLHWGGRHVLLIFPLLGILAASAAGTAWDEVKGRRPALLAPLLLLTGLSLSSQVYGLYLLDRRESFSSGLNKAVRTRPERVIIATDWFTPQELALNFYDKSMFLAESPEELSALLKLLQDSGIQRALMISSQKSRCPIQSPDAVYEDGLHFLTFNFKSVDVARERP